MNKLTTHVDFLDNNKKQVPMIMLELFHASGCNMLLNVRALHSR
jgi:hypothetical protein